MYFAPQYVIDQRVERIPSLAFRKCNLGPTFSLPHVLLYIGDAAFSLCVSLRQICIPPSVNYIGVAAFCGSGLEKVIFEGVPETIEPAVFKGCKNLKQIVVPKGKKLHFCKVLDVDDSIIFEAGEPYNNKEISISKPAYENSHTAKQTSLTYNFHYFKWSVGSNVSLDELFSGPTALIGNPSYQFRRKALFVFMQSNIANQLRVEAEYEIPANTGVFMRKYQEKYSSKSPRIFLFICDDGKVASFYDEVQLVRANKNSITIKSLLRV
jgi:hypothetical protein